MTTTLSLYEHAQVKLADTQLSALEQTVIAQVSFFRRNQPETSTRIILTGLALRRIRASLGHGHWEPWLKRNIVPLLGAAAARTIRNWMRLADAFVAASKLTLPDFLALPGDQTELALSAATDENSRRLMAKLEGFVGGLGPTELMGEHDIRESATDRKKKKLLKPAAPADEAAVVKTAQDIFNDAESHLRLARSVADKALWMQLSRRHHDDLLHLFTEAHARIVAAHAKTHGRKKTS